MTSPARAAPGKPTQEGFVETFNGRPHLFIGYLTPEAFAASLAATG